MARESFRAVFNNEFVSSNANAAMQLHEQARFGEIVGNKVHYSFAEALYLLERKKMSLMKDGKKLSFDNLMKHAQKKDKNFFSRFMVYSDLRNKGYIIKTALKFGADFRVYEKGKKPGEEHSKWIVYPVYESGAMTWHDFAAKNRVAHSTRKNLLIGIVDEEGDVTYYECQWLRP